MKTKLELPFMPAFALVDCAARVFAQQRTSEWPGAENSVTRGILRENAVHGLRYIWRTGDAQQRSLVAARVKCWMSKGSGDIKTCSQRVLDREKQRLGETV
jgi:hypothetical protein